jgi:hypothetical protein
MRIVKGRHRAKILRKKILQEARYEAQPSAHGDKKNHNEKRVLRF